MATSRQRMEISYSPISQDQNVFPGNLAIIPQQPNADCSKQITQDQVNQPAGTGYIIKFANPVNSSDVRLPLPTFFPYSC
jgi:hypothetical protein